jgi:DnaJ-class molecular chaperone
MVECEACDGIGMDRFGQRCVDCAGWGSIPELYLRTCERCQSTYPQKSPEGRVIHECPKCRSTNRYYR